MGAVGVAALKEERVCPGTRRGVAGGQSGVCGGVNPQGARSLLWEAEAQP